MNGIKKILGILMILLMVIIPQIESFAKLRNIESNNVFHQDKIPVGKTGKMMNITFTFTADKDFLLNLHLKPQTENMWEG